MTLGKRTLCVLLILLTLVLAGAPAAAVDSAEPIGTVRFSISPPLCGHVPETPDVWPEEENVLVGEEPCL